MRNSGTRNTSDITGQETHACLRDLAVAFFRLTQLPIDQLHRLLKRCKLAHRVWNLPPPKWYNALVQTRNALLRRDLAPPLPQIVRIRRQRRLHSHLDRLEGTQQDIREELRRCRRGEIHERPVHVGEEVVAILVLEHLVEAVFTHPLKAVAHECWGPAEEDAPNTLFAVDRLPGAEVAGVELRVDLSSGLDEIERDDGGVGWAAGDDAAQHAGEEVFGGVGLDLAEGILLQVLPRRHRNLERSHGGSGSRLRVG